MKKLLYISIISTITIHQAHGASSGFLGRCAQTMRHLFTRNASQTSAAQLQEQMALECAQANRIADAKQLLTPNVQMVLTNNDSSARISAILQHNAHADWASAIISAIDCNLFFVLTKENGQAALKTIVDHNNEASNTIVKRLNHIHGHAALILANEHPQAFAFLSSQLCKTDLSKASLVTQLNHRGYPLSPELCARVVTFMADAAHNNAVASRIQETFTLGQYIHFMQLAPTQTAQLLKNVNNYKLRDVTLAQIMQTTRK